MATERPEQQLPTPERIVRWLREGSLPIPVRKPWESEYPAIQHPTVRAYANAFADAIEANELHNGGGQQHGFKPCGSIQRDEDGGGACTRRLGHEGLCGDGQAEWRTDWHNPRPVERFQHQTSIWQHHSGGWSVDCTCGFRYRGCSTSTESDALRASEKHKQDIAEIRGQQGRLSDWKVGTDDPMLDTCLICARSVGEHTLLEYREHMGTRTLLESIGPPNA